MVLITGASAGIGRATALLLAEKGYTVIATSRSLHRLSRLIDEAAAKVLTIHGVELDVNSDASVEVVVPEIIARHGTIDALVNNAGFGMWGPVESVSIEELKLQFEANFFGAVRMIHAVLPGMLAQRYGRIVNISSVLGRIATPFNGAYVSSKYALEGISESLRTEVAPFGVRVAVVEPGLFETDFQENQLRAARLDDSESAYAGHIRRYSEQHDRFDRFSGDPIKVARVIEKIIRSRRPAFRHPVGADARAGMLGARLLPERLFHAIMSRVTTR